MSSRPPGSPASAELRPGTLIAGFRLERRIGRGPRATVYEATQLSLDRRVAFKLFDDPSLADRVRRLEWPEHPGAVSLFGTGSSDHGPWLAMQLVPGGATLATRGAARLDQVAAALDRAHAQGRVHGNLTAGNVLIDGDRARVSDFGLGPEDATADDDRAALAALVREHPPPSAPRRRTAVLAVAAAALVFAALVLVLRARGGDEPAGDAAPAVPAGTRAVGSALAAGDVRSVDCNGMPASGSSPACTVSQLRLAGRAVIVPSDGTITSWAVRGAQGSLSLQVLRDNGGRLIQVDRSPDETVTGPGVHVATANLAVAAGDRIGLQVAPGAVVGIRGAKGAAIERWFGPLLEPPRPPERPAGTGFDDELLLRVSVRPGTGAAAGALSGAEAARAPDGRNIVSQEVMTLGGARRTATVVELGRLVAVDLFENRLRLARMPIQEADGRGTLLELSEGPGYIRVRWRNPDNTDADRIFQVTPGGLR